MRRLTLFSLLAMVMIACSCNTDEQEPFVSEQFDASVPEQVEKLMSRSLDDLNSSTENFSKSVEVFEHFFMKVVPTHSSVSLFAPMAGRMFHDEEGFKDYLQFSDFTGKYTAKTWLWDYQESDSLEFIFKGPEREDCSWTIVSEGGNTEYPLYESERMTLLFPEKVRNVLTADGNVLSDGVLTTELTDYSNQFVYNCSCENGDVLSATAQVDYDREWECFDYMTLNQSIVSNEGEEIMSADVMVDMMMIGAFSIAVTMYGQLRFEIISESLVDLVVGYIEIQNMINEEEYLSTEKIAEINEYIAEINELAAIKFFYDDVFEGYCGLELLEDNGEYSAEVVLKYEHSGQSYAVHGLSKTFMSILNAVDAVRNILSMIVTPEKAM